MTDKPEGEAAAGARFPALRSPMFVRYLISRSASGLAIQVQSVAVGWQIYDITRNPFDLGLAGLAQFLPYLPLVLVSGAVADRYSRRSIMAACAGLQALCATAFALFTFYDVRVTWPFFLVLVCFGTTRSFVAPAQLALIPHLVPRHDLSAAMAVHSAVARMTVVIGPVVGGFIYAMAAIGAYCASLLLFLSAAVLILKIPHKAPAASPALWGGALFAGFVHIWREKLLLGLISLDLFAVLLGGVVALLPVYAREILHVGPGGLGLLMAAPAMGALPVAIYMGMRPINDHAGLIMLLSVAIFGFFVTAFSLSTVLWLSIICLLLAGAGDMASVCVRQTLVQSWTPDPLRGRVNAVNGIFTGTSNELGNFRAGSFAALFGVVPTVFFGGVGILVLTALWSALFPSLRTVRNLNPRSP